MPSTHRGRMSRSGKTVWVGGIHSNGGESIISADRVVPTIPVYNRYELLKRVCQDRAELKPYYAKTSLFNQSRNKERTDKKISSYDYEDITKMTQMRVSQATKVTRKHSIFKSQPSLHMKRMEAMLLKHLHLPKSLRGGGEFIAREDRKLWILSMTLRWRISLMLMVQLLEVFTHNLIREDPLEPLKDL